MARYILLLFALSFASGCWTRAVEEAAHTTNRIDEQFSALYVEVNDICVRQSADWTEYDACIDPWKQEAAKVARLREVTLSLDAVHGRAARKVAACQWLQAVHNVHHSLPARAVALSSKWRRKC
jgi:hypothetical protein